MATAQSKLQIIIEAIRKGTGDKQLLDNLDRIGETASRVGQKLTIGLTIPITAAFVKAVDAASDLAETMNKVDVVFGDSAASVKAFGEDAADSMGMSTRTALEAAGTFGNLFTSMGIGVEVSADMSTSLLTLAADLASFNNIDPTVALEKLRAGLVGEVEPLRTLGVNLSAAAVEVKALEMGLVSEGETLTAAAKAQASYALILEQTTNAQGDFARTADGLANSTRIMRARIEDAAAEMGENLLPIALDLTLKVSDLVKKFSDLDEGTQNTILGLAGVAAATGPVLMGIGQLITVLPALKAGFLMAFGNPVVLAIAAVTAGLIAMYEGYQRAEEGLERIQEVSDRLDLDRAMEEGIITGQEYVTMKRNILAGIITEEQAQAELNARIIEYERATGNAFTATQELHSTDTTWSYQQAAGMSAVADAVAATVQAAQAQPISDYGTALQGVFERYTDMAGAQQTLIGQGLQMIEGMGAQARAAAEAAKEPLQRAPGDVGGHGPGLPTCPRPPRSGECRRAAFSRSRQARPRLMTGR